jgi:hypothetical protein
MAYASATLSISADSGRVGARIALRPPHRSGRAAFPHPAPPEVFLAARGYGNPVRGIVGVGSGKARSIRLNRSHVMPR